jgi:hypothetical protein
MEHFMKVSVIEIQKITASEGMVLTNGEAFSSPGGTLYLSCNDIPENWWEISAEAAELL